MGEAAERARRKAIYDQLAEEGGGTWATYLMMEIEEAARAGAFAADAMPSLATMEPDVSAEGMIGMGFDPRTNEPYPVHQPAASALDPHTVEVCAGVADAVANDSGDRAARGYLTNDERERRAAGRAIAARIRALSTLVPGTRFVAADGRDLVVVPVEPTEASVRAAVDLALSTKIVGLPGSTWPDYVASLYRAMLEAAGEPE